MDVLYRWHIKSTDITKYTVELPTVGKFSRDPGPRFSTTAVCVCTYSIVKGYSSRKAKRQGKAVLKMVLFS